MAARRLSSVLSRSLSASHASGSASLPSSLVRTSGCGRSINRFSTAAVPEELITPPVQISYTQHLINGQFVDSASGKEFPTHDPRTGEVIAHVAEGDAEDINRAVAAARKAFDEGPWPKMTAYERSRILLRFADLVEKHSDELAALETWNNGKPYEQAAKSELPLFVRLFYYYAGWADKIHGLTVPADGDYHVQTLHEPIGVAGQIIPWNFPLVMFAWKVGPALACGNTIVLKTAEQTPLTALYVAKLFHEAGLPPGVLNVVSGYGPTAGAALASHMDVDKLAFTGSTATGKIVLELSARSNLKPVTLELGGKSPFIVCEDADVDKAVELAHFALFFNQGQCCCAGSRTFVHERIYDEFLEKAKTRAMRRVVGDPFKKGVEQGPQIDPEQFEKILRYIRSGIQSNATLECGGDRLAKKTDKGFQKREIDGFKRGFIVDGLFAYSRHPNFFGEISIWWTYYLFSVSAQVSSFSELTFASFFNYTFIGAFVLTVLFHNSTDLTERISKQKYPEYGKYQKHVSRIIPFLPRYNPK